MAEELTKDQIVAMAVACVAEELDTDIKNVRVRSFREVHKTGLAKFIEDNKIDYVKYQLGDQ
ncbi:MAG: hypothetical protein IJ757_06825 [Clostridiales bacterium]|nr:hypothetical protein [Clostridiales bacterium]